MSSGRIFYQPVGDAVTDVVQIDLGRPWSRLDDYDMRDESVSEAFSGGRRRIVFRATRNVDVSAELLDGSNYGVIRQIEGLMSHLRRGGLCSIAEGSRALAAFCETTPIVSSTRINWLTNMFADYCTSPPFTATAGDILVLSGPSPDMLWEEVEVASGGTDYAVLTAAPVNDWTEQAWVLVRNKGFWPTLRLRTDAPGAGILVHGNRVTYRLDLPMEVPPNAWDALSSTPDDPLVVTGSTGSLDVRVNQIGDFAPPGGFAAGDPVATNGGFVRGKWW